MAWLFLAAVPVAPVAHARDDGILAAVQQRGFVRCGVHRSGVGLAEIRADGVWAGYFVEFCRVVALGALGDSRAIQVFEVDDLSGSLALSENMVDVVVSTIHDDADTEGTPDLVQLSPLLQDQQMVVSFLPGVTGFDDLPPHARVCTSDHPIIRANLERAMRGDAYGAQVIGYESIDGLFNAFFRQRCDALTYHHFAILAQSLLRSPQRTAIWPSSFGIARIAFGPEVRTADQEWAAAVDAAVRAALHDDSLTEDAIPESVRAGFVARVQSIANSSTAIYDRTLGHIGGQGFYPAAPMAQGS